MSPVFIRGTDILGFSVSFQPGILFLKVYTSALWKNEGINHVLMMLLAQIRNDDRPFKMWKPGYVKYVAQAFSDSQAVTLVTLTSASLSMV